MDKIAYVVEGYMPYGGAYMAYHIARILHADFGYDVRVATAGGNDHAHGLFRYEPVFPCVPLENLEQIVQEQDVLICNPSFSSLNLGLKVRGRKLMYVQGFTTFSLIDRFFDHYVAVSRFVKNFLTQTYGIYAPVIPAFLPGTDLMLQFPIQTDPVAAWEARPARSLELNLKGDQSRQLLLLGRVRHELRAKDRILEESIDWDGALERARAKVPRESLHARISAARYLLTLSVAEGFGLVPLESMGMGTVVLGFDGFGGREYMLPGQNCAVAAYADISSLVDGIIHAIHDPALSRRIVAAGVETASRYTYAAFHRAWVQELDAFLSR